ncbi:hypothetical protein Sme01_34100 [Sphaerisporangium melleum]|uniref:Uncharacterized protein n=1 Tax=Sphaerisporangium melleum TaxID=321316 RepID=A0A917QXW1_9ACTN|nr:hypothetical protein GCM10007964_16780 [Sphaerisporangium melleum]GII70934.1 hypothetical protein Sme01_34100 [Sphaerisporangium melleum]
MKYPYETGCSVKYSDTASNGSVTVLSLAGTDSANCPWACAGDASPTRTRHPARAGSRIRSNGMTARRCDRRSAAAMPADGAGQGGVTVDGGNEILSQEYACADHVTSNVSPDGR